jgi:ribosome-binding factor A
VAETVRQVVADALMREVRDPRISRVTVTRVEVTGDLSRARIMVVTGGEEADRDRVMEGLASATSFLRGRVARVLGTRIVPELVFAPDLGLEHAARINEILGSLRRESGD